MGRWLKKVGRLADKVRDEIRDEVTDQIDNVDDIGDAFKAFIAKGKQCGVFCQETIAICDATSLKRQQMLDFGTEIQSTLQQFGSSTSSNNDSDSNSKGTGDVSSLLETIKALTAGDKVKAAMEIAQGLDVAAIQCVEKSKQMIDLIEEGVDSLPRSIQKLLEKQNDDDDDDDDDDGQSATELLRGLDQDITDVQTCVSSIQQMNLSTALTVGVQAFGQLSTKAQKSRMLFDMVRSFAVRVQDIVAAFESMNPMQMASKSREIVRCLNLSEAMELISDAAGKILQCIVPLFAAIADRISDLWSALAFAKDCLMDCVSHIREAKELCVDAKAKGMSLVEKSRSVSRQLEDVGDFKVGSSIQAIRSLSQPDGEMHQAISLARTMDDHIVACSTKFTGMVDRVSEGFHKLPSILTADINVASIGIGRSENDKDAVVGDKPPNVESDIAELEAARSALDDAEIVAAGQAAVRGFSGVSDKATVCNTLLDSVSDFATRAHTTMESFLSSATWNIADATNKITEICQLVNLGQLMKEFAKQIQRLVVTMVEVLQSAIKKFKQLMPAIAENVAETIDDVKDDMKQTLANVKDKIDKVDDLKDEIVDKLQFWK